jgi:hypothetical protein
LFVLAVLHFLKFPGLLHLKLFVKSALQRLLAMSPFAIFDQDHVLLLSTSAIYFFLFLYFFGSPLVCSLCFVQAEVQQKPKTEEAE